MQVELIGCTGAGKTTLAYRIVAAARRQGVASRLAEELILSKLGLNHLSPKLLRTALVDLRAGSTCLVTLPAHSQFYRFVTTIIWSLPGSVPLVEKLNLTRNVLKKTGVDVLVCRIAAERDLIVTDEGTLHAAHNLFVHVSIEPNPHQVRAFAQTVTLPDLAVYVAPAAKTLVQRTMVRGHNRIRSGTQSDVEVFVDRALRTFNCLVDDLQQQGRMVAVDDEPLILVRPDRLSHPSLPRLLDVLHEAIVPSMNPERVGDILPTPPQTRG